MKRALVYITLTLVLASCSQRPFGIPKNLDKEEYRELPVLQFKTIDEAYRTYRSGIDAIMADMPDNPTAPSGPLNETSRYNLYIMNLYKRIYNTMGWSYIKKDNTIFALTSGYTSGCWAAFVSPDHPVLETRGNTLHTIINRNTAQGNLVTIVIRLDKISERWAGLFLVHELAHAKACLEYACGDEKTRELQAYDLEKIAYNHITNDRFDRVLDKFIERHNITHKGMMQEIEKERFGFVAPLCYEIDRTMNEKLGSSKAEMEMRFGFYIASIILRLSERNSDDVDTKARKLNLVLEKIGLF